MLILILWQNVLVLLIFSNFYMMSGEKMCNPRCTKKGKGDIRDSTEVLSEYQMQFGAFRGQTLNG